jgi:putative peptidoglycan lipid II flippase
LSRKLLKATATVSAMTLTSRILGFARDVVVARAIGAGLGADAFFVAFRIPNFLRRLFAEGAFSQAFVPVFAEYKTHRSHEEVQDLADNVSGVLGSVLLLITVLGIVAAPLAVMVFAPGFLRFPDKYAMTVEMLRVTFPYLLFISLTAVCGGILNSYGRFAVPAFTPVFLNLSLIGAALWLAPRMENPGEALAWGVLAGGVVQLAFQLPFLRRIRLLPLPRLRFRHPGVRRVLKLMLPAIFGVSVAQLNLLVDTLIASFLRTGSVSWLYYSDRLMEFPLGMFGIALGTVVLPSLSQEHARASVDGFSRTIDWALRWVFLIAVPATVGLMVLAGPMLSTLFQYGEFSAFDVEMASRSLMTYSLGLVGFILVKVLAPGFYARQDMRTPVKIGVIAMVSNMAFNLALVFPLAHAGLALATSLSAFLNAALLYRGLRRQEAYRPGPGWSALGMRVALASLVMACVLWQGRGDIVQWTAQWHGLERLSHLALWIAAGSGAYFLTLAVSGLRWQHLQAGWKVT